MLYSTAQGRVVLDRHRSHPLAFASSWIFCVRLLLLLGRRRPFGLSQSVILHWIFWLH